MNQLIFQGLLALLFNTLPFLNAFSQPQKVELSNRVSIEFPGQFQRLQIESITIYQFKDSTGTYRATVSDIQAAGVYTEQLVKEMSASGFWEEYTGMMIEKYGGETSLLQRKSEELNGLQVMKLIFKNLDEDEDATIESNITIYTILDGLFHIEVMFSNEDATIESNSKQKFLNSLQIKPKP